MNSTDLISSRKKAEAAVADMTDGPLKVKAFEVILESLLTSPGHGNDAKTTKASAETPPPESPTSFPARVSLLAEESFFAEPRSLGQIQTALAAHGFFYPQSSLSTPLIRLVRQRRLRRQQLLDGGKKVWKYSLP